MSKVFVDTAAWLALLNLNDSLYVQAQQVMITLRQQQTQLITTELVLLEVADALAMPPLRERTISFINGLRQLSILKIVPATQLLLTDGWALYSQRADKSWGLTDCTSFVVMKKEKISQAFTSDRHFEQAGFDKLLIYPN